MSIARSYLCVGPAMLTCSEALLALAVGSKLSLDCELNLTLAIGGGHPAECRIAECRNGVVELRGVGEIE